ncbi:hypothetical protein DERP_001675 [Dermatophagoides pteronyssinus]|uniref:Uncharacterized protein n=1 Tax=Dermatophagoides pteronyssinus TaxID=6956 RepID=A0ABQ8JB69_DERPT|nr:hypothetical protein DERP_001675 [Dermatophagoides pteronyssinus]
MYVNLIATVFETLNSEISKISSHLKLIKFYQSYFKLNRLDKRKLVVLIEFNEEKKCNFQYPNHILKNH